MSKWHRYLHFNYVSDIRVLIAKYETDNYLQLRFLCFIFHWYPYVSNMLLKFVPTFAIVSLWKVSDRYNDFVSKHNQKSFNTRKESKSHLE